VSPKLGQGVTATNVVPAWNLHTLAVHVVGAILHVHHLIKSREKLLARQSALVVLVNLKNGVVMTTKNLVVNNGMLQQMDGLPKETVVVVVVTMMVAAMMMVAMMMVVVTMMVAAMMMVEVVVHDRKYLSM
jgi:hypothetical protein